MKLFAKGQFNHNDSEDGLFNTKDGQIPFYKVSFKTIEGETLPLEIWGEQKIKFAKSYDNTSFAEVILDLQSSPAHWKDQQGNNHINPNLKLKVYRFCSETKSWNFKTKDQEKSLPISTPPPCSGNAYNSFISGTDHKEMNYFGS